MTAYQQAGQWNNMNINTDRHLQKLQKPQILHGEAGKPIPAGALDGITRESVESGRKSVDIKL